MISRSLIFHILFTTTFGNNYVNIFQINEPTRSLFDNANDNAFEGYDIKYVTKLINSDETKIILWFSNFKANRTIFKRFISTNSTKTIVLPIFGFIDSPFDCSYFSKVDEECYYSRDFYQNLSLIVIFTRVWLKRDNIEYAERQIKWLRNILTTSRKSNRKVIIVGYDSPGSLETTKGSIRFAEVYNNGIVELLHEFHSTVSACIFRSDHIDSFRILMDYDGRPAIPMFISATTSQYVQYSINFVRKFTFNIHKLILQSYVQYRRESSNKDFSPSYDMKNIEVAQLHYFTQSFSSNVTLNFDKYYRYQLGNLSFTHLCNLTASRNLCVKCSARCFIVKLTSIGLNRCLSSCKKEAAAFDRNFKNPIKHNNAYFVLAVIVLFVVILVGIVFVVNKGCCCRRNHSGNVFLAPLTLNVQTDIVDDISVANLSVRLSKSKETGAGNVVVSTKPLNGHRRSNHESEQTYDYIRM